MIATLDRVEKTATMTVDGNVKLMLLDKNDNILSISDAHLLLMKGGSDVVEDTPWPDDVPWYSR